jgi:hypothetical protein
VKVPVKDNRLPVLPDTPLYISLLPDCLMTCVSAGGNALNVCGDNTLPCAAHDPWSDIHGRIQGGRGGGQDYQPWVSISALMNCLNMVSNTLVKISILRQKLIPYGLSLDRPLLRRPFRYYRTPTLEMQKKKSVD